MQSLRERTFSSPSRQTTSRQTDCNKSPKPTAMDIESVSLLPNTSSSYPSRLRSHKSKSDDDGGAATMSKMTSSRIPSSPGRGGSMRLSDFEEIQRTLRKQWFLLSTVQRVYVVVLLLISISIGLSIYDSLFHKYQIKGLESYSNEIDETATMDQYFAVVINTYKRPDFLKEAVIHYADKCGQNTGIESVCIVWAEEGVTPPEPDSFFRTMPSNKDRSFVNVHPVKNSLNNRFQPIIVNDDNKHLFQSMTVPSAIFMVDDDMRIDCFSLRKAFEAWKLTPKSMVGFYPRLSVPPRDHKDKRFIRYTIALVYQSWPIVFWKQQMNFILTKACFLHKRYMDMYMSPEQHPVEILDYVDKYMNCEDVAMSMLVANITRAEAKEHKRTATALPARPIYVEGKAVDKGLFKGISTNTGHMKRRSDCLTDLSRIYAKHGWEVPLTETFDLRWSSYKIHAPDFWFQMSPSNPFEWFALSNVLK